MIPELGHFALVLALVVALVQVVVPTWGVVKHNDALQNVARTGAYAQCLLIIVCFGCLAVSFLTNDFSVAYVAQNSNSMLPKVYQFCAVWGAHEGSLLLWVTLLTLWMAAVAKFSKRLPLDMVARVLVVLSLIAIGFYLLLLVTSNPFLRILPFPPADGRDLNALLQDSGLVSHPPMLYTGYVGFSVAFAFAIAALWSGRLDAQWANWTRPWTLLAWSFLTLGITLGSLWAYRVLGWGGWWAWDPVENASLMPWLVGTALIHSLAVADKRDTFKAWTVLMAICAFSLSLVGTFLVRSGVLVSVHAFAVDATRGAFILKFLTLVIGSSLLLYAWRAGRVRNTGQFQPASRETLLLSNNVLFTCAMLTVLLGTLYPLMIEALGQGKLSVGAPYFNAVIVPLFVPILFLMGLGPLFRWRETNVATVWRQVRWSLVIAMVLAIALPWWFAGAVQWGVVLGLFLAFWIVLTTVQACRRLTFKTVGMSLAHIGMAVLVMGMVLTSTYSQQREVRMRAGESVTVGAYNIELMGVRGMNGPNYEADQARFRISQNGQLVAMLFPEHRLYTVSQMAMPTSGIDVGVFRDVYVVLGQPLPHSTWSVRVYVKPFIRWIWGGGLLIFLGGLSAAIARQRRLPNEITEMPIGLSEGA